MRIALSYHGGHPDYDDYTAALCRRGQALGVGVDAVWLAGEGRAPALGGLDDADAVVLTGGADVEPHRYGFQDPDRVCVTNPERDGIEWEILERLRRRPRPLLAICRGAQLLNVFHGGTLIPDLGKRNVIHRRDGEERRVHDVAIVEGTRLHRLVGKRGGLVNSSHHQAVGRLAAGFRLSGVSTDDAVIEAYESAHPDTAPFVLAVQWHPEAMEPGLPLADRVLDAFLTAKH
ncbi:MAG TPA: gamma-glutamyl-gamma-aminobutyrate hydrolase family protein [Candidatus Baltobacteraceae bacterium]|nr:gamma-glutamyl-gamma-aminobutyrate hydrolase family protein [Candidatus Baltobacteraceae bacterium]